MPRQLVQAPEPFRFSWVVFLACLVSPVADFLFNLGTGNLVNLTYAFGHAAGTLVLATLLAYGGGRLIFWLTHGEQVAATIVATLVALMVTVWPLVNFAFGAFSNQLHDRAAQQTLEADVIAIVREMNAQQAEALKSGETLSQGDQMRRLAKAYHDSAQRNPLRKNKALEAMGDALDDYARVLDSYDKALLQIVEAGGLDVSTLSSLEALESRTEYYQAFESANLALAEFAVAMPDYIDDRLMRVQTDTALAEAIRKDYREGFTSQLPHIKHMRELDSAIIQSCLEILSLLHRTWGHWEYDTPNAMVLFEDDESIETFQRLIHQVSQLVAEQDQAQQQFLTRMQRRLAP